MNRISVLGAGSWGTALSVLLHKNGHAVTLWEFQSEVAAKLRDEGVNHDFLPGIPVPSEITITSDLQSVIQDVDVILCVLPSHVVRDVCEQLAKYGLSKKALIVSATKGIENHSLLRISEIFQSTLPGLKAEQMIVLSGPSHAEEVAKEIPTVITAASTSMLSAERIQSIFMNPHFRVYANTDIVGVELGGSLKNVIAIAAGISDGVGCGDNTKAALMTRGIVEITRLGVAMGANPETFSGLSGVGDLIVTCTSQHSRNRFVGEAIGKGQTLHEVLNGMVMVAEGVRTTQSVMALSEKYHVDMPITREVFNVLFKDKNPKDAVYDLMTRGAKSESV